MRGEADFLLGEEGRLRQERSNHETQWGLISRYTAPDTADLYFNDQGTSTRRDILDNTAEGASEMASAGLHAMLTNPATPWMGLGLYDEDLARSDGGAPWLERASKRMHAMYAHSWTRFAIAMTSMYRELIDLGNGCIFIDGRVGLKLPLYRHSDMASTVWDEDGDGNLVVFKRRVAPPLWSVAERWKNSLPPALAKLVEAKKDLHRPVELLHCVGPRERYDRGRGDNRNMAIASYWIAREERWTLEESGYHEQPFTGFRWHIRGREKYGRGCGHKALPEAVTLQRVMDTSLTGAEQAIRPPLQIPSEGVMNKNGKVSLRNGAPNYLKPDLLINGAHIRPINTNTRPDLGLEFMKDIRARLERAYLKDLLQLIRDPEATATHVLELKEEQNRGMSPIVARLHVDLGLMVERSFAVLQRMGGFEDMPAPPELVGMPPRPVFISPATRAQALAEARGIAQAFDSAALLIKLDPSVTDEADLHKAFRTIMQALGVPMGVLVPTSVSAAKGKARAEAAAQVGQLEQLKDVTTAGKNIAPLARVAADVAANGQQPVAA